MDKEIRTLAAEFRATADDNRIVEGYAAKFNVESEPLGFWGVRESIAAGAFADSLRNDNQYIHWNHNDDIILGSTRGGTLQLSEDEVGLKMRAELPDTQWGRDTYELVKRGDVTQMSFGFQTRKQEWDETDPENIKRKLLDVRLFEVSIVPYPAYPQTEVQARDIDSVYKEYRAANSPEPVPEPEPVIEEPKTSEVRAYFDERRRQIIKILEGDK